MPTIHYILKDGTTRDVDAKVGASVMETAIRGNVRGIDAECGGCLSCATCHVYIDASSTADLPSPDESELELLDGVAAERRPESRLSCQLVMSAAMNGLVVQIPQAQG